MESFTITTVVDQPTFVFLATQSTTSTKMATSTRDTFTAPSTDQVSQYNGNPFDRNLHDHDAPCAVCYVKSRGSMLMMPARNDCSSGWTEEYHGYLMTEYHGHKHSREFICVDGNPEYVPGSMHNRDGALLYPVEGVCGSLPCLPYVAGRELTCAVCTK